MDYAIELLEIKKWQLNREIMNKNLLQKDIRKGISELSKVTEITKAIKILKSKKYKHKN
ncbi:hypothetical protein [Aquimarina sp. MAR_2010_214]|uniref:hypothetical protein n=1 Tax=Aquimarina sp. MAR_2010_214 TaxID=1250026 RepID=UPI0013047BF7|nr:hypothetical protein [Aquimarina sp. MAR_2010_214]